jgi:hypothetical protein
MKNPFDFDFSIDDALPGQSGRAYDQKNSARSRLGDEPVRRQNRGDDLPPLAVIRGLGGDAHLRPHQGGAEDDPDALFLKLPEHIDDATILVARIRGVSDDRGQEDRGQRERERAGP